MYVLNLDKNQSGRDFVVGDIHGHTDLLEIMLRDVAFDGEKDRLISVGDLIDRGPDSLGALEYLEKPWFYCVRGNHEDLLIESQKQTRGAFELWMRVGGLWATNLNNKDLATICEKLQSLPYVIQIETSKGLVGVVHADIPTSMNWQQTVDGLNNQSFSDTDLKSLIWSRDRFKALQADPSKKFNYPDREDNLKQIYVGHSIVSQPMIDDPFIFIDTGAFCGGALTAVEIETGTFYFTGIQAEDQNLLLGE